MTLTGRKILLQRLLLKKVYLPLKVRNCQKNLKKKQTNKQKKKTKNKKTKKKKPFIYQIYPPYHKIDRIEAVGLFVSNKTFAIRFL